MAEIISDNATSISLCSNHAPDIHSDHALWPVCSSAYSHFIIESKAMKLRVLKCLEMANPNWCCHLVSKCTYAGIVIKKNGT
ncbi:hypothetical protein E2C01_088683 [Portunus trituberculatus]|uniref:Uncharacterized protein n=1 Tax=Portunus trituberculatus TaxID=210409 RepID=A0A5B7J9Y6_PORTR|nr:hypothetical protein [Portunus trituberculatus]